MRSFPVVCGLALIGAFCAPLALAQNSPDAPRAEQASLSSAAAPGATAAAPTAAGGFSVDKSTIGQLLDHPQAHEVFARHFPGMVADPQLKMARNMTLPQIVPFDAAELTPDRLASLDSDLKTIPAR